MINLELAAGNARRELAGINHLIKVLGEEVYPLNRALIGQKLADQLEAWQNAVNDLGFDFSPFDVAGIRSSSYRHDDLVASAKQAERALTYHVYH